MLSSTLLRRICCFPGFSELRCIARRLKLSGKLLSLLKQNLPDGLEQMLEEHCSTTQGFTGFFNKITEDLQVLMRSQLSLLSQLS